MNRINRIRQYKKKEKALQQRYRDKKENEVSLEKADFKDGKLSVSGYTRLKQHCDHIGYEGDIEIKLPKEYAEGFMDTLECLAANELSCIKKEIRNNRKTALGLLTIGVLWYLLRYNFVNTVVLNEITLVATWVFVWAAVEKWFFDHYQLSNRRHRLLQLLLAKITGQE